MAVIIGAKLIIKAAVRDPIIIYDLKRNKSPRKKPITPDKPNQNQLCAVASSGKNEPLTMSVVNPSKKVAKNKRIMLTESEPIR